MAHFELWSDCSHEHTITHHCAFNLATLHINEHKDVRHVAASATSQGWQSHGPPASTTNDNSNSNSSSARVQTIVDVGLLALLWMRTRARLCASCPGCGSACLRFVAAMAPCVASFAPPNSELDSRRKAYTRDVPPAATPSVIATGGAASSGRSAARRVAAWPSVQKPLYSRHA